MKRFTSILCASLLTLAMSSAALAGNITTLRNGNITTLSAGNITTLSAGNITTIDGNITTLDITDVMLTVVLG